jgi:hypothetical protein
VLYKAISKRKYRQGQDQLVNCINPANRAKKNQQKPVDIKEDK